MKNRDTVEQWLRRARSNFVRARAGKFAEEVLYEDLCFDLQQTVEKAFKALCIARGIIFPRTHDLGYLLELIEKETVSIPSEISEVKILTEYAVAARYPGAYESVSEEEYHSAVSLAKRAFDWVEEVLEQDEGGV